MQKIADRNINAYLFTSYKNAAAWINKKIIKNPYKCKEVQEASTYFIRKDKLKSQTRVGMSGVHNFLWVGRLNKNKDPLTVLKALKNMASIIPTRLYMIYQDEDLLEEVKNKVLQSIVLEDAVNHWEWIIVNCRIGLAQPIFSSPAAIPKAVVMHCWKPWPAVVYRL